MKDFASVFMKSLSSSPSPLPPAPSSDRTMRPWLSTNTLPPAILLPSPSRNPGVPLPLEVAPPRLDLPSGAWPSSCGFHWSVLSSTDSDYQSTITKQRSSPTIANHRHYHHQALAMARQSTIKMLKDCEQKQSRHTTSVLSPT